MKTKHQIPVVLRLAKESPGWMALTVVLAVLSAATAFIPYAALSRIVESVLLDHIDFQMISICGVYAFAGAAANVVLYFASLCTSHLGAFDVGQRLRLRFAEHISRIPLGDHLKVGSGKMLRLMKDDIASMESFLAHQVPENIIALLSPVCMLAIMLWINVWYTVVLCLGILGAYYFNAMSYSYAAGGGKKMMDIYLSALDDLGNECNEYVRGIRVAKVFGGNSSIFQRLKRSIRSYTNACVPYTLVWEKYRCIFSGAMSNLYLLLLPMAAFLFRSGNDAGECVSDLILFLLLTPSASVIIPKLEGLSHQTVSMEMALKRLDQVLQIRTITLTENLTEPCNSNTVEFRNVSFRYGEQERLAVENLSFVVKEGSVTGIVGPSGSGKSTIVSLLGRFWNVSDGEILIGGVDIQNIQPDHLMKKVAFVLQDPFLFQQSIADNIRGGNHTVTMDAVIRAAKAARCHDFIMELPKGYETVIGQQVNLSGGERQRIAIARAILQDAPILVLDEATAATDLENEREIQLAVEALTTNKTVIMISHRLSNVIAANQILFMEDGKILEQGSHTELLRKNGRYAEMWKIYQENINWKL